MALTSKDPYTLKETMQVIAIGIEIERLRARGKSTAALERQADGIRRRAQEREDAKVQAREDNDRAARLEKATRRETRRRIRREEEQRAREARTRKREADRAARKYKTR